MASELARGASAASARSRASLEHPEHRAAARRRHDGRRASPTSSWSTSRAQPLIDVLRRQRRSRLAERLRLFRRGLRGRPVRPPEPRRPPRPQARQHPGRRRTGSPKLLDFGIAKLLTREGAGSTAAETDGRFRADADARVREPRAGARRAGDDRERRLLARRRPLRAAGRPAAVPRSSRVRSGGSAACRLRAGPGAGRARRRGAGRSRATSTRSSSRRCARSRSAATPRPRQLVGGHAPLPGGAARRGAPRDDRLSRGQVRAAAPRGRGRGGGRPRRARRRRRSRRSREARARPRGRGPRRAALQRRAPARQLVPLRVPRRDPRSARARPPRARWSSAGRSSTSTRSRRSRAATATLRRELAEAYRSVGDVQGNPFMANLGDVHGRAARATDKAIALLEPAVGSPGRDRRRAEHARDDLSGRRRALARPGPARRTRSRGRSGGSRCGRASPRRARAMPSRQMELAQALAVRRVRLRPRPESTPMPSRAADTRRRSCEAQSRTVPAIARCAGASAEPLPDGRRRGQCAGDLPRALERYREAAAMQEALLREEPVERDRSTATSPTPTMAIGNTDEALERTPRPRSRRTGGPSRPSRRWRRRTAESTDPVLGVAMSHHNVGETLAKLGRPAEALAEFRLRALGCTSPSSPRRRRGAWVARDARCAGCAEKLRRRSGSTGRRAGS